MIRDPAAYTALHANLREAWVALAMIREAVETLGPVGCMPSSEAVATRIAPTFTAEAEAIVAGIQKISAYSRNLSTAAQ